MTTRTRKATTAPVTTTPTEVTATAATTGVDYAPLAAQARNIPSLPKSSGGGGGKPNPFTELVARSAEKGEAFEVPAPDDKTATAVQHALGRAARTLGLKVATRRTRTDAGPVVSFKASKGA